MPEEERRALSLLDLDKPASEQFGPVVAESEEERDFIGQIASVPIEASAEDRAELESALNRALYWALEGATIVEMGWRMMMVMKIWRSPVIAGLALEFQEERLRECRREVGPDDDDNSSGRIFEWLCRAASLGQLGQRLLAMAYVVNPGAIGSMSLQAIGRFNNKTRQAVDKLVGDFRDTFGGIRSGGMRDDENRMTCRMAQLRRSQPA